MSQHIVVGVDGSAPARAAVRKAATLARALDAHLHVVCAYDKLEVTQMSSGNDEYRYATDEDALSIAEREATMVRDNTLDVSAETAQGKPADVLLKVAEKHNADLIVVGNRRVQGMSRLLGSIASSVAAKAGCDVYIAHTN